MSLSSAYLFTSARLGFRNWKKSDIAAMATINADPAVMEFFPSVQSQEETAQFVDRMQEHYERNGFCYYVAEQLSTGEIIGFTGLSEKTFEADFTPCIDIGWRFAQSAWNKGFATEAAKRCLQHAFEQLHLSTVVSMAPVVNVRSIAVMQKAGMHFDSTFEHPLLLNDDRLRTCALYYIHNPTYCAGEI